MTNDNVLRLGQCFYCKHKRPAGKCDAFPEGIPREILFNRVDHRKPYPGDNGIQWEAKPEDEGKDVADLMLRFPNQEPGG